MPTGSKVTTQQELDTLGYLVQGFGCKKIGDMVGLSQKTVNRIKQKHKDLIAERKTQRLFEKKIDAVLDDMLINKSQRLAKTNAMITNEINKVYEEALDPDTGELNRLASGDYTSIVNIHSKDERDIIDLTKSQDSRKRNTNLRTGKEQDIILKLQEMANDKDISQNTAASINEFIKTIQGDK